jgi:hypothetical protein
MKRNGFSSNSCVTRNLRRARRVLVAAGFLAVVAGLWPAPAQAKGGCIVYFVRFCGPTICCMQSCIECYDSQGNPIGDPYCGDPICFNKNV